MLKKITLITTLTTISLFGNDINDLNQKFKDYNININCTNKGCVGNQIKLKDNTSFDTLKIDFKDNVKIPNLNKENNKFCNKMWDITNKTNLDEIKFKKECNNEIKENHIGIILKTLLLQNNSIANNIKSNDYTIEKFNIESNLSLFSKIESKEKLTEEDFLNNKLNINIKNLKLNKTEYEYYLDIIQNNLVKLNAEFDENQDLDQDLLLTINFLNNLSYLLEQLNNKIKENQSNLFENINLNFSSIKNENDLDYMLNLKVNSNIREYEFTTKISLLDFNKVKENISKINSVELSLLLLLPNFDFKYVELVNKNKELINIHKELLNNKEYKESYEYLLEFLTILFEELKNENESLSNPLIIFLKNFINLNETSSFIKIEKNDNVDSSKLINEILNNQFNNIEELYPLFKIESNLK